MQSGSEPKQPQLWCGPLPGCSADRLASLLSAQELAWGEALPQRRRLIFWQTRAVVRQQLAAWLGCTPEAVPLLAPPAHYPQLAAGWGYVSWSHSGEQLLLGWSPQPVGVDLEPADRPIRADSLWRRLCPGEPPPAALADAVLQRWVGLEALTKRRCSSIAVELGRWSWQLGQGRAVHRGDQHNVDVVAQRHHLHQRSWWLGWSGGAMPAVALEEGG